MGQEILVASVPREKAQQCRLRLDRMGLVEKRKRIAEEKDRVLIPLLGEPDPAFLAEYDIVLTNAELSERDIPLTPQEMIRARVAELAPETPLDELPERWDRIGDAVCLRLPPGLENKMVARAYAEVLGATAVVSYGSISGVFREPEVKLLWGDAGGAVTTHLENGIYYKIDVLKLMFSSGNVDERIRMSTINMDGEQVVDMFAGIGYFTIPMAVYSDPKRIDAYELNPVSHKYLLENIENNGVSHLVYAHNKSNMECPENTADRILMGYVGTTHEFLPKAVNILKDKGGWLHYHETCPDEIISSRPIERIAEAAKERSFTILSKDTHIVKSYAPGISHIVVDALLG